MLVYHECSKLIRVGKLQVENKDSIKLDSMQIDITED